MRQNPYFVYLILQLLSIPTVIILFRLIPDHKIASVFTGGVFMLVCLGVFYWEAMHRMFRATWFWAGGLQFFILFALPIFLLRFAYWNLEFTEIHLGPIPATALHHYSNFSYMLWMATCLYEGLRFRRLILKN